MWSCAELYQLACTGLLVGEIADQTGVSETKVTTAVFSEWRKAVLARIDDEDVPWCHPVTGKRDQFHFLAWNEWRRGLGEPSEMI